MKQKNFGITMISLGIVLIASGFYTINAEDKSSESPEPVTAALAAVPEPASMTEEPKTAVTEELSVVIPSEPTKKASSGQSNVQKGEAFEDYVISKFDFSRKSLTLLSRADNSTSATKPDLDIKLTAGGKYYRFAVECVWRQNMPQESLDWCKEGKIEALKNYEKKRNARVFIIVGIGGSPRKPTQLYIVPLDERPYANIYTSVLQKYKVTTMEGKFFYETSTNTLTIK